MVHLKLELAPHPDVSLEFGVSFKFGHGGTGCLECTGKIPRNISSLLFWGVVA